MQQSVVLEWHGQKDLTWTQLVPTLQKLATQSQTPDVLIVHLNEKDLLSSPWPELSGIIKKEVALLKEAFPKVRLMWSEMLPQNFHPAEGDALKLEQLLCEANSAIGGFMSDSGGIVIKHVKTKNTFPILNLDGGGLSHVGLDLFLDDIKNAIRTHVLQSSGATSGEHKKGENVSPFASLVDSASLVSVSQEVTMQGDLVVSSSEEASRIPKNTEKSVTNSQPASCASHWKKRQKVEQKLISGTFNFGLGENFSVLFSSLFLHSDVIYVVVSLNATCEIQVKGCSGR